MAWVKSQQSNTANTTNISVLQPTISFSNIYIIQFFHSLLLYFLDLSFICQLKEDAKPTILCGDKIVYCNTSYVSFQPVNQTGMLVVFL